jgi:hypothetical protein
MSDSDKLACGLTFVGTAVAYMIGGWWGAFAVLSIGLCFIAWIHTSNLWLIFSPLIVFVLVYASWNLKKHYEVHTADKRGIDWNAILKSPLPPPTVALVPMPKPPVSPHLREEPAPPDKPPTLSDLFKTDFPNVLKGTDDSFSLKSSMDSTILPIKRHVYMDFEARAQFVGFYIPSRPSNHANQAFDASMALIDAVQPTIDILDKHVSSGGDASGIVSAQDLVFSGRVFLYHEEPLSNLQKAEIVQAYHARNYDVNFRGLDYLGEQVSAWYEQHNAKKKH